MGGASQQMFSITSYLHETIDAHEVIDRVRFLHYMAEYRAGMLAAFDFGDAGFVSSLIKKGFRGRVLIAPTYIAGVRWRGDYSCTVYHYPFDEITFLEVTGFDVQVQLDTRYARKSLAPGFGQENCNQLLLSIEVLQHKGKIPNSLVARPIGDREATRAAMAITSKGPKPMNNPTRHQTVFISYGGPDESVARIINDYLRTSEIKTWFFPDDHLPGQKLHRMMHEGVNQHDRVLLICSRSSLGRPGVLNEIEHVLEREARLGGGEILIPVSIDDYVFGEWEPSRPDIAEQVRSRVISRLPSSDVDPTGFSKQMERLKVALKKYDRPHHGR